MVNSGGNNCGDSDDEISWATSVCDLPGKILQAGQGFLRAASIPDGKGLIDRVRRIAMGSFEEQLCGEGLGRSYWRMHH